jgi:hypothetical protein
LEAATVPWRVLPSSSQILAVHAALVHTGHIVMLGGDEHDSGQNQSHSIDHTRLFDCATLSVSSIASPSFDVFCCGHALVIDGRLLIAGGTEEFPPGHGPHAPHFPGLRDAAVYNPRSRAWTAVAPMSPEPGRSTGGGRWYPTLVTLAEGIVLAISGHPREDDSRHNNDSPEAWSASPRDAGTWRLVTGPDPAHAMDYYPRVHVLPDGTLFFATPVAGRARRLRVSPYSWIDVAPPPSDPIYGGLGASAVLLPLLPETGYRPRVLYAGGGQPIVIDLGAAAPSWQPTSARALAGSPQRTHSNAVLLANGHVLVCGGVTDPANESTAVRAAEIFDPFSGNWSAGETATVVRNYHSVALLMPDGRVWTAGSNKGAQQSFPAPGVDNRELRIELYEPAYMAASRPAIAWAPAAVGWGERFDVQASQADRIRRVALIRAGSNTHAFDPDQRFIGMTFTRSGDWLHVKAPPSPAIAPPGYYLLVTINDAGVPSAGRFVRVSPRGTNAGFMIQSNFGVRGNLEAVVPRPAGGLAHFWRNDDQSGFPWSGATPFDAAGGAIATVPSLIQSNFGVPGNLEVVARRGDRLVHYWRESGPPWRWSGPIPFGAPGASGNPALIQGIFGGRGNFEVVTPLASGGLAHYWRNNDQPGLPWNGPTNFAQSAGRIDAVALIQSTFGDPGNLEVVARIGDRLAHFWRDSGPPWTWHGPIFFFRGAEGIPGLVQSHFGTRGNFEVVTPRAGRGAVHLWRNNDATGFPWSGASARIAPGRSVRAVALVESNFGRPGPGGNLEALFHTASGRNLHFYREDGPPWRWAGPTATLQA